MDVPLPALDLNPWLCLTSIKGHKTESAREREREREEKKKHQMLQTRVMICKIILGHITFDLLKPKSNQLIFVSQVILVPSLAKILL